MKFEFLWDPFIIIIRDVFTEKENKEILAFIKQNRISGCQFHPELSRNIGSFFFKNICQQDLI